MGVRLVQNLWLQLTGGVTTTPATDTPDVAPATHYSLAAPPLLNPKVPVFSRLYRPRDRQPAVPVRDTAVEIEIDTKHVLHILTTPDGTVGGFFGKRPTPKWLEDFAKKMVPAHDPRQVSWDALSPAQKMRLLQYGAMLKQTDFHENRSVEGICVRPFVTLRFDKETVFLGHTYAPGTHEVDVSKVLSGKVEYRTPREVNSVRGVELHFREGGTMTSREGGTVTSRAGEISAGTVSRDAWIFLDGLSVPRTHQHVHIVAPMPFAALRKDPIGQALRMTDFMRRANAVAEMIGILWHGQPITDIQEKYGEDAGPVMFQFIKDKHLSDIYYVILHTDEYRAYAARHATGWVDFCNVNKYDDPNLYGVENRWLRADTPPDIAQEYLDTIQMAMLSNEFGISAERIEEWRLWVENRVYYLDKGLEKSWFHKSSWQDVLDEAAPVTKSFLAEANSPLKRARSRLQGTPSFLEKLALFRADDASVDLILHDWSFDPLLFDNPKKLTTIASEQIRALKRLEGGEDLRPVTQDFLKVTGLFVLFAASLGGKKSARQHT